MSDSQRIALTEDLTIYHALDQKQMLLDALNARSELELDLSGVREIDTAGLQLLVMLKKEALRTGKRCGIVAHSQPVRELIEFCNLGAELQDPLIIPASESR